MREDDYVKRLKNAYLTLPLGSIEVEKGVVFKSKGQQFDLKRLDTQFLAIKLIDFLSEKLAAGHGASTEEIESHLTGYLETMCPAASEADRHFIISRILDRLANGSDGYRAFRYAFFNPTTGEYALYAYKLIEWWQPGIGEAHVYKATPEAVTLFLSMLTIDPILENAAQNFLIKHLLEAGHVAGAVEVARKASGTSKAIQASIQNRLLELRRNPRKRGWVDDILLRLGEATSHIGQRLGEERVLLETIGEMLDAKNLGTEQKGDLIRLKTVVEECMVRHLALSGQINDTVEDFHKYQALAFRSPRLASHISPERDLLPDVLDMPLGEAIVMANAIGCHFLGPKPPKVLDLFELFTMYMDFHERTGGASKSDGPKIEEDDVWNQLKIDPQRESRIRSKVVEMVETGSAHDIVGILDGMGADENRPEAEDIACAMHVLQTVFRGESPLGIEASVNGEFEHRYAAGINLALSRAQSAVVEDQGERS